MKQKTQRQTLIKWDLYTPQQKEIILAKFRKRLPNDYYCKTTLFKFLQEKVVIKNLDR